MLKIEHIDALFIDFDGVLTDNCAYVNEMGIESVKIARADGLAFQSIKHLKIPCYVLSTEKNKLVQLRSKKLKIKCYSGIKFKEKKLIQICNKNKFNLKKIIYIGNDINDLKAMKLCGHTFCPYDSHPSIKKIVTKSLKTKGGEGVVRELIENVLNINIVKIL